MKLPSVYPLTTPSSQSTIRIIAMVSNMRCLHSSSPPARSRREHYAAIGGGCNLNAARCRAFMLAAFFILCGVTARAQDSSVPEAQPNVHRAADTVKFLGGAALGLAMHESGHLIFDVILDTNPRL